eukprot:131924_1
MKSTTLQRMNHIAFCVYIIVWVSVVIQGQYPSSEPTFPSTEPTQYPTNPSYAPTPQCGHNQTRNGYCESYYNIPECDYDWGDCCEQSCNATGSTLENWKTRMPFECGDGGFANDWNGYDCKDPRYTLAPTAQTVSPTPATLVPTKTPTPCYDEWMGDMRCNEENNNAECNYDDGDCCWNSCLDLHWNGAMNCCYLSELYPCDCRDPDYVTPAPTSAIDGFKYQLSLIGKYKAIGTDMVCIDHSFPFDTFGAVGTWTEITSDSPTLKRIPDDGCKSAYYAECSNYTLSTCDEPEYLSPDSWMILTYCCARNY